MVMSLVSYSVVFARSAHRQLLAASLVQGGFLCLRLITSGEALAQALLPLTAAYMIYLSYSGRRFRPSVGNHDRGALHQ